MKNKILVVVAHSDDEVLGCGGAIAKHAANGDEVFVLVLTEGDSSRENSNIQKRAEASKKAAQILGVTHLHSANFKDQKLDALPLVEIVNEIENSCQNFQPHIVYTHSEADLNIDHVITHRAVMTDFRPVPHSTVSQILTFEIPSSTEWGSYQNRAKFIPNYFIELTDEVFKIKMAALNCYTDEIRKFPHPRSEEYLTALAKVRGGSIGVNLAEAFFSERVLIRS